MRVDGLEVGLPHLLAVEAPPDTEVGVAKSRLQDERRTRAGLITIRGELMNLRSTSCTSKVIALVAISRTGHETEEREIMSAKGISP